MQKIAAIFCLLVILITACSSQPETPTKALEPPTRVPNTVHPTETIGGDDVQQEPTAFPELPLPINRGEYFVGSGLCATCHSKTTDQSGKDVSIDSSWRATMMANASRDPYWKAAVRNEVEQNPAYQEIIEDKCSTCHTPMATFTDAVHGKNGKLLDDGYLNLEHTLHGLADDGVSCTLCHQIENENLGDVESFSGGYVINPDIPTGERLNYGPYQVSKGQADQMQSASGFIPAQSLHIQKSELCGTCHVLYTPTIDENSEILGEFPEQMTNIEWLNSSFVDTKSCQDCHMPVVDGDIQLSITGGPPRNQFSQHELVGGNTEGLLILRYFGEEIGVTASSQHIDQAIARAKEQLQNNTATIQIDEAVLNAGSLSADVSLESLVGHKLPTGYPSRRVWVKLDVYDANNQLVFSSGAVNLDGSIAGNDNDLEAKKYEPHYEIINSPDQVQIYETILHDATGEVTTELLRSAGYQKDNRLLPSGYDKRTAPDDIAVYGFASDDENFQANGDKIRYEIDVTGYELPFRVDVQLLYQAIGYRWAENIAQLESLEAKRFGSYYQSIPHDPVVLAEASLVIE
jgi:hypothetical protein